MLSLSIAAMVRRMVFVFARVTILGIAWLRDRNCSSARGRPLNQLVEFTPVEPNTPTLGTVVYFNALALGHQEVGIGANGAFHKVLVTVLNAASGDESILQLVS
jgi:hypothetical protein